MSNSSIQYSGRPQVDCGYVEPTLAGYAHEIILPHVAPTTTTTDEPITESTTGRLFLGPQQAARKDALGKLQSITPPVTGVVSCTLCFPNHHEAGGEIEYCNVPVYDENGCDLLSYMNGATQFVDRHVSQGGSVLVNCTYGVSRSATIVMAYLIRFHGMTRQEAYVTVKQCRPRANPNVGFWEQLGVFERRCRNQQPVVGVSLDQHNEEKVVEDSLFTDYVWEQLALYDARLKGQIQEEASTQTDEFIRNVLPSSFRSEQGIRQSLATFQTIGHLLEDSRECFPELMSSDLSVDISRLVLFAALHFVYSRGIQEADLPWFGALCRVLTLTNGVDCSQVVAAILEDKESEFVELWSGEICDNDVTRIQNAVRKKE